MLDINNKKIAIIGTSPIMIMIAKILSMKNNSVTLFEKKKVGGAWAYENIMGLKTNIFTNVLVPSKKFHENKISKINVLLRKMKVKIQNNKNLYKSVSQFNPKKIYKYDFSSFFKNALRDRKIRIKKINVKNLKEDQDCVLVNNKLKFNMVVLPLFNSLNSIILFNKKILIPFKKIVSKHIIFISKKPLIKDFYYSEKGHSYFDRMQIKKNKNFYIFTARISKKFKKKSKIFFIKKFSLLNNVDLRFSRMNSYINYYRDKNQINHLKRIKFNRIKVIDTKQLYDSISNYLIKS